MINLLIFIYLFQRGYVPIILIELIPKFLNSIDIEGVWIDGIITFVYPTFQHEY